MLLYRFLVTSFAGAQQTGTGGVCMTRTGPAMQLILCDPGLIALPPHRL
jgi:hypothetical protein